jgi:hypothetical protein
LDEALEVGEEVGFGDTFEQLLVALLGLKCGLLALGQLLIHGVQLFNSGGQLFHSLTEGGRGRRYPAPAQREGSELGVEEINLGGVIMWRGKGGSLAAAHDGFLLCGSYANDYRQTAWWKPGKGGERFKSESTVSFAPRVVKGTTSEAGGLCLRIALRQRPGLESTIPH